MTISIKVGTHLSHNIWMTMSIKVNTCLSKHVV